MIIMFYGYIVDVVAHCLKWPFKASLIVEFTQVIILCGFCNELQLKNTCRLSLFSVASAVSRPLWSSLTFILGLTLC